MLSVRGRRPTAVLIEPVAKTLLNVGLTPNLMTVISAFLTIVAAVLLIPTGHLFAAAVLTGLFAACDLIDGTMARMRGGGTTFGATLDATCDRITDGVLFACITWWLIYTRDANRWLVAASFMVLVSSQVISYVKARGEASGLKIVGGIVERAERLIVGLVGLGLTGLGLTQAIDVALYLLAVGSIVTVVQRLVMAAKDKKASNHLAPPPGAKTFTTKPK